MKRSARPVASALVERFLYAYEQMLRTQEDLTSVSIRNYPSDLRHFVAWYEQKSTGVHEDSRTFTPDGVATSTIIRYRAYLQRESQLKPASVNRTLISLKRNFGWLVEEKQLSQNPAKVVKLVEQEEPSTRHLSDQEERGPVAAVTTSGSLRDRTLILLLLHTGLRAREACTLRRDQVQMGKRSSAQQHGTSSSPGVSPDAEWAKPVSLSLRQDDCGPHRTSTRVHRDQICVPSIARCVESP